MSFQGRFIAGTGAAPIETLTGDVGGPIAPNALGNITLTGTNPLQFTGNPLTNTLTLAISAATEIQVGASRFATALETVAGISTTLGVNPAELNVKLGNQTLNGLIYGQGGVGFSLGSLNAATNGQLPVGNTGNPPTLATLTAGPGITITNGPGSITIGTIGTTVLNYINVAATPYVVGVMDDFISVNSTVLAITIELPNAPVTGRVYVIKDRIGNAAVNNITVRSVSGAITIDGILAYTINTNFQAIKVLFNGTTYEIY
jgi:hypothetical protein